MSDLTKNGATLHVHFDNDVLGDPTQKPQSIDENGREHNVIDNNGTITLNYSRDDLLRLRNCLMAKRPPKFADDESQIDDKRREKIRMVVKMNGGNNFTSSNKRTTLSTVSTAATDSKEKMPLNESISLLPSFALGKYRKNAMDTVVGLPAGVDAIKKDAIDEKLPSDRDRLGFQQLMATVSGPNTVNPYAEQSNEQQTNSRRQRVGSGRITENSYNGGGLWNNGYRHSGTGNDKDVAFHLNYGVDYRGMNNDFFDKRHPVAANLAYNADRNHHVGGERSDAYEWNKENNRFPQIPSRESSTEPEWVSCGPTSKHDVIELHGFDGPHADTDDNGKLKEAGSSAANSPPARSTPTKAKKNHEIPVRSDEHFNFEDFFKLELPSGNPMAKGPGSSGESRFTQWFRRDSPPKKNATGFDANMGKVHGSAGQSFASTEQFIDLMHKTHGKKIDSNLMASSAKFRSVEELEAELVAPSAANHAQQMNRQRQEQTKAANDLIEFRKLLTQMEQQIILQQQQQQQQNKANIVQQLYLLQQMNKTSYSQRERERETLMALLNVCNDNFMPRYVPQQPPPFMGNVGQNFRQFQANIGNGNSPIHSPTQQELQFHTQAIMQNALLKKQQHQKQYQHSQQRASMTPSPQPIYHNQNYGQPQFRNNKVKIYICWNQHKRPSQSNLTYFNLNCIFQPKFNQMPKDGFQLMAPPQTKPIFGRFASQRAGHANPMKFQNSASSATPVAPVVSPAVAVNNTADAVTSPAISLTADK